MSYIKFMLYLCPLSNVSCTLILTSAYRLKNQLFLPFEDTISYFFKAYYLGTIWEYTFFITIISFLISFAFVVFSNCHKIEFAKISCTCVVEIFISIVLMLSI